MKLSKCFLPKWSGTVPLPIVAVNSALLPNGSILMSEGQSNGGIAVVWDPATGWIDQVPVPVNQFCSGWEQMGDGRIDPPELYRLVR